MDKNIHLPGSADEFIENNLGLARKVAWGFAKWANRKDEIRFDEDDYLSISYIGLMKAYKKFDPTRFCGLDGEDVKFSTYAVPMIKGEILREIRDRGYTIGRKREKAIIYESSLDAPIGSSDEGGKIITLAEHLIVDDCTTDERIAVNDFLDMVDPRTRRIYELRALGLSQKKVGKIVGVSQVQIARIENKMLELAKEYGEGGITDMSKKTDRMNNEVTTIEQFYSAGGPGAISNMYGVSMPTVYALRKKLTEKRDGVGVPATKSEEVKMGTTPYSVKYISQSMDIVNTSPEGRQAPYEQRNTTAIDDCTIDDIDSLKTCAESFDADNDGDKIGGGDAEKETIYYFEGLAEPEPIWTPFIENEQHEKQELDLIAEKWFHIEHSLRMVRKMHLDKAEQDFKDRLELFLV